MSRKVCILNDLDYPLISAHFVHLGIAAKYLYVAVEDQCYLDTSIDGLSSMEAERQ